jgi:hypothetical protein
MGWVGWNVKRGDQGEEVERQSERKLGCKVLDGDGWGGLIEDRGIDSQCAAQVLEDRRREIGRWLKEEEGELKVVKVHGFL